LKLSAFFKQQDRFRTLHADTTRALKDLPWPKESGVYVIRKRGCDSLEDIIYVGKTGKIMNDKTGTEVCCGGGKLSARFQRWTPYCFQAEGNYIDHFEFGPNYAVNQLKKQPFEGRYRQRYPISEITVECLITGGIEMQISPALLESLILNEITAKTDRLPLANQEL
jgi:hypothetical protein